MHAVRKYLEQWAEPEARLAGDIPGGYERTLVVPACREEPSLVERFVTAAQTSRGRTLCILVVNGPDEGRDDVHAENARLLDSVREGLQGVLQVSEAPRAWLGAGRSGRLDVLVVDRASDGARLPRKEGVGLARKIGADLALALHDAGKVSSRWIFGTDADATLPVAHFDLPALEDHTGVAAVVFPFWHEPAEDPAVTRATALYELGLRYHVAGLAWAGSPYAFHTLGSTIAVSAEAYAAVRGYPKRDAAEDFYLLNKIAKVGGIARVPALAVRLDSRPSDRTPFGTGAAVQDLLGGEEARFSAPACFAAVRFFRRALDEFADHADIGRLRTDIGAGGEGARDAVLGALDESAAWPALESAVAEPKTAVARKIRLASWFDAFRSLKLLHAVRDAGAPDLPWRDALSVAPFGLAMHPGDDAALAAPRMALALRERASGASRTFLGPTSLA